MNRKDSYIVLILVALFIGSIGSGIYSTIFNNYLETVQHFNASERGFIELPRELPGIFSMVIVGVLFFLCEVRISALAMLLCTIGSIAMAIPSITGFWGLIAWIVIASLGQHIILVITDAIVIHTASPENRGLRLGQMRSLGTAAGLLASLFIWVKWKFNDSFSVDFIISAFLCLIAAVMLMRVRTHSFPERTGWRQSFIFKRAYFKYYLLETLYGARKQIFLTFAFWLLVSTFKLSPVYIGKTLLAAGLLGLFVQPFIGKMIQHFGEARVLSVDAAILFMVCIIYAFATDLLPPPIALFAVTVCFVIDNLLTADGAARAHYLGRICERKEDITPSLYTGMAINHVISIIFALIGGWVWTYTGKPEIVFVFSAFLAMFSGIVALTIPRARIISAARPR